MCEWQDVRMKTFLICVAGFMAAAVFAQESPAPARRSPEQIFQFLDKDKNGTLSEVEFSVLKEKMPSLRQRPEAVGALFKRLDKDGNGSLTLEEFRALPTQGSRRPGAAPAHGMRSPGSFAEVSSPTPALAAARRSPMPSPEPKTAAAAPLQERQDTANQPVTAGRAPQTATHIGIGGAFLYQCDDACLLPGAPVPAGKYAVVSPVGKQTIKMITQAPRLDSLNGKTIAVVGGSFMASIMHPEIKRLILANYPTAKVILLNEIGSAGPYPGPGVIRPSKDEFQKKLKEMGVNAVISGNGGCGLCTPKEAGSSIAAEYIGIPAVTIAAPNFVNQVHSTAVNHGVPASRAAAYPGAFSAHTPEELIKNTREVVWPQIIETLTKPITATEIAERCKAGVGAPKDRVFAGTVEGVNRFFTEQRWSDGLPIIPPTVERVEEFLSYTDQPWDAVVGVLPIAYRETLVWHVAVNGVMSGCPPEFMPVLIAYTKALADGDYRRTLASTHAWTPFCWINGPIARQLGIDAQQGQINEPRNAALGRFINLAMMNLGGYYIKQDRMGSFGYLMPWAMAEDEAACLKIGWQPYHVQKGYDLNQSTLTAASALMWGNNLTPASHNGDKIMEMMAWDAVEKGQFATGSGPRLTNRTVLITEYVARDLARTYATKEKLEAALIATARRPAYERAYANYWANPGSAFPAGYTMDMHVNKVIRNEGGELTVPPPWMAKVPGQGKIYTVPVMKSSLTAFLVTGDADRNKVQTMPGGNSVTIEINLPPNWDELMEKLGYRRLKEFRLTQGVPK